MFEDDAERPTTNLRGRLADVFFPALLADSQEALSVRLGERATLYHPLFGSSTGLTEINAALTRIAGWLGETSASFQHVRTLIGKDRDVCEGQLAFRHDGAHVDLPVGIVMERRKSRECDVRIYHATLPLKRWQAKRLPRAPLEKEPTLPSDVAAHLAALRLGDPDAIVAGFEADGQLRDGTGRIHARTAKAEGASPNRLHEYYVHLLQNERGANDWVPIVRATADDGRFCSVEYEIEKLRGDETAPKEGMFVFERGDSGLLRSVRIYDEIGYGNA